MTRSHQWKKLPSDKIDEWALHVNDPDRGTEHHGPLCEVCGMTFCMHCAEDRNINLWDRLCPGPPPEGKEYVWEFNDSYIPTLYPLIGVKKGYHMIGGKARLVEDVDLKGLKKLGVSTQEVEETIAQWRDAHFFDANTIREVDILTNFHVLPQNETPVVTWEELKKSYLERECRIIDDPVNCGMAIYSPSGELIPAYVRQEKEEL